MQTALQLIVYAGTIGLVEIFQRACLDLDVHLTPEAQILLIIARATKRSMDYTSTRMFNTASSSTSFSVSPT